MQETVHFHYTLFLGSFANYCILFDIWGWARYHCHRLLRWFWLGYLRLGQMMLLCHFGNDVMMAGLGVLWLIPNILPGIRGCIHVRVPRKKTPGVIEISIFQLEHVLIKLSMFFCWSSPIILPHGVPLGSTLPCSADNTDDSITHPQHHCCLLITSTHLGYKHPWWSDQGR